MQSPTKAIDDLWRNNSFKHPGKTISEVEEELRTKFDLTPTNTAAFLKTRKYLTKKGGRWVQKYAPLKELAGLQIALVEAGKPRTAVKTFESVIKDFDGELVISDPYLTEDALDLIEKIKAKAIRFLFLQMPKLSPKSLADFQKENQHVIFRKFDKPHLHDRYILDADKFLLVGHGLSLRNKETFLILLDDTLAKDLRLSLLETFNRRWKEAQPV